MLSSLMDGIFTRPSIVIARRAQRDEAISCRVAEIASLRSQ
jgi:hypothetical protein